MDDNKSFFILISTWPNPLYYIVDMFQVPEMNIRGHNSVHVNFVFLTPDCWTVCARDNVPLYTTSPGLPWSVCVCSPPTVGNSFGDIWHLKNRSANGRPTVGPWVVAKYIYRQTNCQRLKVDMCRTGLTLCTGVQHDDSFSL